MVLASTATMSRSILKIVLATWLRCRYFTPTALLRATALLVSPVTMATLHPTALLRATLTALCLAWEIAWMEVWGPLVSNCALSALASCGDDISLYAIFYRKKCDVA
jgi:hypothetical protein